MAGARRTARLRLQCVQQRFRGVIAAQYLTVGPRGNAAGQRDTLQPTPFPKRGCIRMMSRSTQTPRHARHVRVSCWQALVIRATVVDTHSTTSTDDAAIGGGSLPSPVFLQDEQLSHRIILQVIEATFMRFGYSLPSALAGGWPPRTDLCVSTSDIQNSPLSSNRTK